MAKFNEYIPAGGWTKCRRRQRVFEAVKGAILVLFILGAYLVAGYIERGL